MARAWWVNQSARTGEVANDIIWVPDRQHDGSAPSWHWTTLEQAEPGDIVFHYTNQHIVGISEVSQTAFSATRPYPDQNQWNHDGRQLPIVYGHLASPIPRDGISIDLRITHTGKTGPFDASGGVQQGYFFPVSPELCAHMLRLLQIDPDATIDTVGNFFSGDATDRVQMTVARLEQRQLRHALLAGRTAAPCGICGRTTSQKYLVAAHIKPRAHCTIEERRDLNVAMLTCLIGCDTAFEQGGIYIDEQGAISVEEDLLNARPETFKPLDGTTAPAYTEKTAPYFLARTRALQP